MADETMMNGEFSDAQSVEIAGDDDSAKISGLTEKISDLERENGKIIRQNEDYRQKIDELKASIQELSSENAESKKELEELQSENRMLGAVAARAAELEAEVSRLQHDLVSTMSDLQESNAEISDLKRDLEGAKEREKEKDVELDAMGKERDLLLAKVGKLEEDESSLRGESEGKEKEIRILKKKLEDLEVVVESNKVLEKLRSGLEKTVEQLRGKISALETSLDEKQEAITGFETKERAVAENFINGDALVDGETRGLGGGSNEKKWLLVGGSTIAAVAVMGVACYVHAARKH
ncbi:peroxisomal and mitochondrial division factor 2-like [Salvia miltiorrhiza]|uniref:peroxisomal and mitochondrial division factor 2-like n=1 Tax=Salvia miltiorrhiza TaxID=226208 RepID=UPI0025ABD4C2|nr:peroxisomal and mitochondrial division factor 2-like [Salvia miltiorrhiza]XP_057763761.1 peroxisomal and mitochondrial division factor 2-like [Salvia miltiorrhiza]